MVTQREREAQYDQRDTARRALPTHEYEALATQHLVHTLARKCEAHNYNVQVRVRQLDHEADVRFSQGQRENCHRDSLRKQVELLKISEKYW